MRPNLYGLTLALVLSGCANVPETAPQVDAGATVAPSAVDAQQTDEVPVVHLNTDERDRAATLVCRHMLQPGSNVAVRRCMTLAEWGKLERRQIEASQRFLRDALERSTLVRD